MLQVDWKFKCLAGDEDGQMKVDPSRRSQSLGGRLHMYFWRSVLA